MIQKKEKRFVNKQINMRKLGNLLTMLRSRNVFSPKIWGPMKAVSREHRRSSNFQHRSSFKLKLVLRASSLLPGKVVQILQRRENQTAWVVFLSRMREMTEGTAERQHRSETAFQYARFSLGQTVWPERTLWIILGCYFLFLGGSGYSKRSWPRAPVLQARAVQVLAHLLLSNRLRVYAVRSAGRHPG